MQQTSEVTDIHPKASLLPDKMTNIHPQAPLLPDKMTNIHPKVPPLPNKMILTGRTQHCTGMTDEAYKTVPSQQQRRRKKKQDLPKRMTIIGNLKIVPGLGNAPKVVPSRQRSVSLSQDEMAQVPQIPRRMTIVGCPDQPYLREDYWKSFESSKVQPHMSHGMSQITSKVTEHCTQIPQDFDTSTVRSPQRRMLLSGVPEIPSEMLDEGMESIAETTLQRKQDTDEASNLQEETPASSNMANLTNLEDISDMNQQVSHLLTRMSHLGLQGLADTSDTDLHLTQLLSRMSRLGLQDLSGTPKSGADPLDNAASGTDKGIKLVHCLPRLSQLSTENIAEEDGISHQSQQSATDMQEVDILPPAQVGIATPASSAETPACHQKHTSDGQSSDVGHQGLCTQGPFCEDQSQARCSQTLVDDEQAPRKACDLAESVGDLTPCTQASELFSLPVAVCTRGLHNLQDGSPCNTDVNQTIGIDSLPTDLSMADGCLGSVTSVQEDNACVNAQQCVNPLVRAATSTVYSTIGSIQEGVNDQTARGDSQLTCLPVALESALEVLLMEKCLQSWTVSGTKEHAVVILRLTSPHNSQHTGSANSMAGSEQSCHHTGASLDRDDGKINPHVHATTSNGGSIVHAATSIVNHTGGFMHKDFDDESPVALCLPWFGTPQPFCLSKPRSDENEDEERNTACAECSDHFLYCYSSDTDASSDPGTMSGVSLDWFEESLNLTLEKGAESQALPLDCEQSLHQPSFESEDETCGDQPDGIGGEEDSRGNADSGNIQADSLLSSQTSLSQYIPESAQQNEDSSVENITPNSEKHPCKESRDSREHRSIDCLRYSCLEETPAHQSDSECLESDKERSVQTNTEKTCQQESLGNETHRDTASRETVSHYESNTQSENSMEEESACLHATGSAESDSSKGNSSARGIDPHEPPHFAGAHEDPCLLQAKSSPVLLRQQRSSGAENNFVTPEDIRSDVGETTSAISKKILTEAGKPLRLSLRNSNSQLLEEVSKPDEVF